MIGVPITPRRVFGVSFRAGDRAGALTWVCRAHPGSEGLRVESSEPFERIPGGHAEAAPAMRALVGKILEAPASAWGFDTALGLAGSADEADPAGLPAPGGAEIWRRAVQRAAALENEAPAEEERRARRRTDVDHELDGPLSEARRASTAALARGVITPLLASPQVAVLPMMPLPLLPPGTPPAMRARAASTYLLEVEPGALLRRLAEESESEHGQQISSEPGRAQLLRSLVKLKAVRPVPRALREHLSTHPRAMEALLCAVAAWRGYRGHAHDELCRDPGYGAEGFVYC